MRYWWQGLKIFLLVVVILVPIIFIIVNGSHYISLEQFQRNHERLTNFVADNWVRASLLYIFLYIIITVLSLPIGAVLSVIGGFLFGAVIGTILTVIGATLGAVLFYGLVRFILGDYLKSKAVPFMKKMRYGFEHHAFSYLFILRLLPLFPFFIVNLVPALLNVRLVVYTTATFLGIIPGSFAYNAFGAGVGEILERGEDITLKGVFNQEIIIAIIILMILAILPIIFKKSRLFKRLPKPPE